MTVAELIEKLREMPPQKSVYVRVDGWWDEISKVGEDWDGVSIE